MSFRSVLSFVPLLIAVVACSNENSNSSDRQLYSNIVLNESDPRFSSAFAIILNRCASCHSHQDWAGYTSNAAWLAHGGLVIKGNASGSSLIQNIQNGSMPLNGSIPASETQKLIDWINGMP